MTFDDMIKKYADVLVNVGIGLRAGQHLWINASRDAEVLVYEVVRSAYQAGSPYVNVHWGDDKVSRIRLDEADIDSLHFVNEVPLKALLDHSEDGGAFISIITANPSLMEGVDSEKLKILQRAQGAASAPYWDRITELDINGSITVIPSPEWAAVVFPDLSPTEQMDKLWNAIFKVCRLDVEDPVAAWQAHAANLTARHNYLNAKHYAALHYTGPGTDLRVGLPAKHLWLSAYQTNKQGIRYFYNFPTEEIYSVPHREQVDGVVRATMPLNANGTLIEDFALTFKDGRVVDLHAAKGEQTLRDMIEMDEGAACLGEVALVPHSSPISQMGFIFYHTLYDENAASHLALGRAYPNTVLDGLSMTPEELEVCGANYSHLHLDFMVGSAEIDIDGITADGQPEAVMRGGEWAFDV